MRVRRADCGHLVSADCEPNITIADPTHGDREGYACDACLAQARAPRVETKDVRLAKPAAEETDPYRLGRIAGAAGQPDDSCPYPDRRTKDAKEWLRGHREAAEGDGKPNTGA
jgi:ribosome modulation factor